MSSEGMETNGCRWSRGGSADAFSLKMIDWLNLRENERTEGGEGWMDGGGGERDRSVFT